MISMVIYSEKKEELNQIKEMLSDLIPRVSGEKWQLRFLTELGETLSVLHNHKEAHLLIFDITRAGAVTKLEEIRESFKNTFLLLVADMTISPMCYMKPSINGDSLLLRPMEEEHMRAVLRDFLVAFIESKEESDPKSVFKVETRGEIQYIPYHEIYYFEARKRKLYLRTIKEEYQFSGTMEHLQEILGQQFIRCHRSFIVNAHKIVGVTLSAHTVQLVNALSVPLSRGYRENLDKIIG